MALLVISSIMISVLIIVLFKFLNQNYNPPVFGVYQQRNKYFLVKFVFMYVLLRLKQLVVHVKRFIAVELGNSYDGTVHIHQHDVALEQKYPLGDNPQAVDAVYFNGMSKDGAALVCGIARRPNRSCDAFLIIKMNNEEMYLSPSMPHTVLEQTSSEEGEYSVQGMSAVNFIPMRTWKVSYDGQMKRSANGKSPMESAMWLSDEEGSCLKWTYEVYHDVITSSCASSLHGDAHTNKRTLYTDYTHQSHSANNGLAVLMNGNTIAVNTVASRSDPEKQLKVKMDLTWSAYWPVFNYGTHMSPYSMAVDVAKERWSADFFKRLEKYSQKVYEQMGFINGSIYIGDKQYPINMPCVRDHSFGKLREWRNVHRYVHHFIFLENGDCMAVGTISQPVTLSHLTVGYVCLKSNQAVLPVTACDFKLWMHGENQILPTDYGFIFKAGGEHYAANVQVKDETMYYVGKANEAKFYDRWSTVEVNGVKGWCCSEWQYNNIPANDN